LITFSYSCTQFYTIFQKSIAIFVFYAIVDTGLKNKEDFMHILVIGGAGYIGSHVVKNLLDNQIQVTVFDDLSTGKKINLFEQADFIEASILDEEALHEALSHHIDGVVFLAGKKAVGESMENPQKYAKTNLTGAINVLNAMTDCGVNKIIFSSSAAVYGAPVYTPLDEKHPVNPLNFYGFTKLETENLLRWYDQLKGIRFVALRYFNAVGYDADGAIRGIEDKTSNLMPLVMEAAIGKRAGISIFGNDYDTPDGTAVRDYIHVTDLAVAHRLALQYLNDGHASDVFNLGTGKGVSVMEIVTKTQELIDRQINITMADRRAGDPAELVASSDKAKALLGWQAEHSDIENIIRTTWNVYRTYEK